MSNQLLLWERDRRNIERDGFNGYCQTYCRDNDLKIAKHQNLLINKLETAMTTPNYRLMLKLPPGHAKSTYASILVPPYFLGHFPKKSIIMTTHTQEFSDRWGRRCRSLIQAPSYNYIFKTGLCKDSAAVSRFDLTNGSSYFGSGILGNFTGLRGDLILGDDWYRGVQEADSEVVRQNIWEAYIWDLRTRLKPGGSIVLIGTPWHEDDHFGRILLSNERDKWDVVELPALAVENDALGRKIGEPLWPEYISLEMLTDIRDSLNKQDLRMWNSLYQVRPTIDSGDYFIEPWIQRINLLPEGLDYYGASDYAVSAGKGDYTVHAIIGYDSKNDDVYVVMVWREQTTTNVWVEEFLQLAKKYKTLVWAEESGQIIKSLDPFIQKEMQNRGQFVYRQQFTCATDKTARARAFQAYMAQRKVFILNEDWTDDLVKELLSFPSGKHDDQVDALGLIGRMLKEMVKRVEKTPEKEEYDYKSSTIILPGLDVRSNKSKTRLRNKI